MAKTEREMLLESHLERERRRVEILEKMVEDRTRELFVKQVEVRQALDYLTKVIETARVAILATDDMFRVTMANLAAAEMCGVPQSEIIGKRFVDLLPGQSFFSHAMPGDLRRADGFNYEYILKLHDEAPPKSLDISISLIREKGQLAGLVCVAQETTKKKALEAQLLQAQKLESVGQLASGIAHELNTPIQYVRDNTLFLQQEFEHLLSLVTRYRALISIPEVLSAADASAHEIQAFEAEMDVEYLMGEIPLAIAQTLEGAESVASIVRSMKEFAHPGTEEKRLTDINRCLETTATMSKNEWKYTAELRLELDPRAPLVPALAGELHQTFLNMIVNAAHAVTEANQEFGRTRGEIVIRTNHCLDGLEIRMRDNGKGMPESIQRRIFDPFFTTKEPGRGSGQGLALARSTIVDKHGGRIEVSSTPDVGTEFLIFLPSEEIHATTTTSEQPLLA